MSCTYYNEIDSFAAQWLRNLIAADLIPAGDVDERSIRDVQPDDVRGYVQCHFFAGIGGWAYAARLAGWPDNRALWTGSCPCQPFSVAGRGRGADDDRHLWPDFFRLIRAARAAVVMGEQVAGAAGYGWLDGVRSDLEGQDYACRAVDIPACAVDAPHIRSRLYWCAVADTASAERGPAELGSQPLGWTQAGRQQSSDRLGGINDCDCGVADAEGAGRQAFDGISIGDGTSGSCVVIDDGCDVGNADVSRLAQRRSERSDDGAERSAAQRANGSFWSDAEWITCHDGKARRAQPGVPMLVDGLRNRASMWRGLGNAIVAPLAAEVIRAFMDVAP